MIFKKKMNYGNKVRNKRKGGLEHKVVDLRLGSWASRVEELLGLGLRSGQER